MNAWRSGLARLAEMRTILDMAKTTPKISKPGQAIAHPFRGAVFRGLAVLCPPLLTVLIIVWAINTTKSYFLEPVTGWAREGILYCLQDVRENLPLQDAGSRIATVDGAAFRQLDNGTFIPLDVYEAVQKLPGASPPSTGQDYYRRYIDLVYLRPFLAVPFFLAVFVLLLYFLGKFMAVGIGRFFWGLFDRMISSLPVVRSVYSSIKQVSDFLFSEREFKFTRIVAVEFPSKGLWSMGFVTSENFMQIEKAAKEPVLTVLIPYSPIPHTGCTVVVRQSACIDLNITFDQACQFIVSCGVVVPPPHLEHLRVEKSGK
jgi:uncharacterized membrane protein